MKILNMGLPELFLVGIIALLLLGPSGMKENALKLGRFVHRLTRSEMWLTVNAFCREMREVPARVMREAELEELRDSLNSPANFADVEIQKTEESIEKS